jgi:L-iditol 2-dehydrogenase
MRAVVYRGVNDLRLETVPVPRIGADELLVKVAVCGVCPTDIKKIQHGTVPPPRIFGHETAGTIVKIGVRSQESAVENTPHSALRTPNFQTRRPRRPAPSRSVPRLPFLPAPRLCPMRHLQAHRHHRRIRAGGRRLRRIRPRDADFVLPGVVKIPAKNSFAEGAMLEPVNTVLKAVKRLNLLPGDAVLVAGQGPIGLMFTKILQLRGIRVLATDLLESRLPVLRSPKNSARNGRLPWPRTRLPIPLKSL